MSDFWEAYKDPRWQRKRLEAMSAADFTCERCGAQDKTLNVHHKRYVRGRKPWEYELGELVTYCDTCHKDHHALNDELNSILSKLSPPDFSQVLGYAKGLSLQFAPDVHGVSISSWEEARGLADAWGIISHTSVDAICRCPEPVTAEALNQIKETR